MDFMEQFHFNLPVLECTMLKEEQCEFFKGNIAEVQTVFNKLICESELARCVAVLPCDLDDGSMEVIERTWAVQPYRKASLTSTAQHLASEILSVLLYNIKSYATSGIRGHLAMHPRLKVKVCDSGRWRSLVDMSVQLEYLYFA